MADFTREELNQALQPFVSRAELAQLLETLSPKIQLAVVNGIKEATPQIFEKISDKYGEKINAMHATLYDDKDGLVIVVDRMNTLVKELPDLIRLKWQLYGVVIASNIVVGAIGFGLSLAFK